MVAHDLLRAWFIATRTRKLHAAETLGISRQAMHNLLNGADPSHKRFDAIAAMTTAQRGDTWADRGFCVVPAAAWFHIGWEDSAEGKACIAWANKHGAGIVWPPKRKRA